VQRDPESRFFSGLSALQQMIDTRFRGNDGKRFHVILKEALMIGRMENSE
jgi:hypothetical protein